MSTLPTENEPPRFFSRNSRFWYHPFAFAAVVVCWIGFAWPALPPKPRSSARQTVVTFPHASHPSRGTEPSPRNLELHQADDDRASVQHDYRKSVQPILQNACGDCHYGKRAKGGFQLDSFQTWDQMLNAPKQWTQVEKLIRGRQMPPADADPLPPEERDVVLSWLERFLRLAAQDATEPGCVPVRRLNRIEYRNTIRDLLGIDYRPALEFPGDDVGYGFDNIAEVMSLPPLLLEKYLQAAETLASQAIIDPAHFTFRKTIPGNEFSFQRAAARRENGLILFANTTVHTEVTVPHPGKYRLLVRGYGEQAGDDPVKISVRVSGQPPQTFSVTASKGKVDVLPFEFQATDLKNRFAISFLNDFYNPRKRQDRNFFLDNVEVIGPIAPPAGAKSLGLPSVIPDDRDALTKLTRKILVRFASRAYRRPVTSEEIDRLLELFKEARAGGDSFEGALRLPIEAILVSPHFLYRVEKPVPPGTTRSLDPFERATRLSYFLWSTMPDEELFRLASEGKLADPIVYRQQVARMLKHPKSSALVDNFLTQWLQLRHLEECNPDPTLFPSSDRPTRSDMITETKMLFADIMRRDASLLELLDAKQTFINQRLANLYGVEGVKGDHFRPVPAEKTGRRGLLTQASILTLTSNPTRTSPVKRGKWIMENLLNEAPPPPGNNVMTLEEQTEITGTIRERMAQHRADPQCASCHVVMDQLGFALENFDAVGRWRDNADGEPVDASGLLPDGTRFDGAEELQQMLKTKMRKKFVRCVTQKLLIYAIGRGLRYDDERAVDAIVEAMDKKDNRFSELVYQIVTSDPFLKRHGPPLPDGDKAQQDKRDEGEAQDDAQGKTQGETHEDKTGKD